MLERAGEVDGASTPHERRRAWGQLAPAAAGSFVETVGRVWVVNAAVGASLLLVLVAALVDADPVRKVAGVVLGVLGVVVTWGALWRKARASRQWAIAAVVLVLAAAMIVLVTL